MHVQPGAASCRPSADHAGPHQCMPLQASPSPLLAASCEQPPAPPPPWRAPLPHPPPASPTCGTSEQPHAFPRAASDAQSSVTCSMGAPTGPGSESCVRQPQRCQSTQPTWRPAPPCCRPDPAHRQLRKFIQPQLLQKAHLAASASLLSASSWYRSISWISFCWNCTQERSRRKGPGGSSEQHLRGRSIS